MPQITAAASTFTRPNNTTQYTSGDLVANNTTAGSVNPLTFNLPTTNFKLQRVGAVKSNTTNTNASFRLHLYSSKPVVANGDNASWSSTISGFLGDIDIDMTIRSFSSGSAGFGLFATSDLPAYLDLSTPVLYGLLEARASYTPTAKETFTVTLYGETY